MKKLVLLFALVVLILPQAIGQRIGIEALNDKYPLLMGKFRDEVQQQRAAYFFVIDVSGSMNQYKPIVEPAMKEFFSSLQESDYVDVIRFGEEAEKVTGCYGNITREKIASLCRNADNIYFKQGPSDPDQKRRLWNNTNMANALKLLADEMHQIGITNSDGSQMMQFVFLITDFEHDPASPDGSDWAQIKQRFEDDHKGALVNVVALQLPGRATHLDQVKSTFPRYFSFKTQRVADGPALNSWFTDLKNRVLHERFGMLVLGKQKDANVSISPSVDINGKMKSVIRWTPNELFDSFTITSVSVVDPSWGIDGFKPMYITADSVNLSGCKLVYKDKPLLPIFASLQSSIVATIEYNDTLMDELKSLLGEDAPTATTATATVSRPIFSHHLTLGWCVFLFALLLLYIIMDFVAASRNRKGRIQGNFYVTNDGVEITDKRSVNNASRIAIGAGAAFLPVPNCLWLIEISEKKVPTLVPFMHFRLPSYKVNLIKGNEYVVAGKKHRRGTSVKLNRRGFVIVDKAYKVHWIN